MEGKIQTHLLVQALVAVQEAEVVVLPLVQHHNLMLVLLELLGKVIVGVLDITLLVISQMVVVVAVQEQLVATEIQVVQQLLLLDLVELDLTGNH